MKRETRTILLLGAALFLLACGNETTTETDETTTESQVVEPVSEEEEAVALNKGIGPIESLELGEIDQALANEGEEIYNKLCTACHLPTEKLVGPPQKGVLDRRTPEWVMNFMLNTEEMLANDADAKALLEEYNNIPMLNSNLTEDEARAVLEYIRTL